MLKRMLIMLVVTGIVFGGVFGFQAYKARKIQQVLSAHKSPPQTVSTTTAASQEWRQKMEAVGNVRAINGANLSSEVSGTVSAIHFVSGADVKQGDLLVEMVSEADAARLDALKATAKLARITFDRNRSLVQKGSSAISQSTLDADQANLDNANAQVAQQKATLDYKFVRAPFPGRIGIVQVDIGQYVAAGTPMVSLQQIDPIYVDFYLPQRALATLSAGATVTARVDTYPNRGFAGKVAAIDAAVDTATRNIKARATFENPNKLLLPGMFASVELDLGAPLHQVTVPATAISYNSYGDFVYVVDKQSGADQKAAEKLTAKQVFVEVAQSRGGQVALKSGVKDGDVVVTSGQVKLRNGTPVIIDNSVQPSANPNPNVGEY